MPDTASLAECILDLDVQNYRKVTPSSPVVLLPSEDGPRFADPDEVQWDDTDEPVTVVKFSRAVQALRGEQPTVEPVAPPPPKAPPAPAEDRGHSEEVPGLNDVWGMGDPDLDIWMSIPDDEAPTCVRPQPQPGDPNLTGPFRPPMDPLPALEALLSEELDSEEKTIRRDDPAPVGDDDVELVYLLKKKKKN